MGNETIYWDGLLNVLNNLLGNAVIRNQDDFLEELLYFKKNLMENMFLKLRQLIIMCVVN